MKFLSFLRHTISRREHIFKLPIVGTTPHDNNKKPAQTPPDLYHSNERSHIVRVVVFHKEGVTSIQSPKRDFGEIFYTLRLALMWMEMQFPEHDSWEIHPVAEVVMYMFR